MKQLPEMGSMDGAFTIRLVEKSRSSWDKELGLKSKTEKSQLSGLGLKSEGHEQLGDVTHSPRALGLSTFNPTCTGPGWGCKDCAVAPGHLEW